MCQICDQLDREIRVTKKSIRQLPFGDFDRDYLSFRKEVLKERFRRLLEEHFRDHERFVRSLEWDQREL